MRETRLSGSEGGGAGNAALPTPIIELITLRLKGLTEHLPLRRKCLNSTDTMRNQGPALPRTNQTPGWPEACLAD
jgi:hypothetical protein